MRIAYLGSGAFGLPTLELLLARHQVVLAVTQPDRPAGRGRRESATPVGARLAEAGVPLLKPADVNDAEVVAAIRAAGADALVVIAFGQKLKAPLLEGILAINLHGSLLPRHRGAAPVNWAILAGDLVSGVSAITLAQRMDAGAILGERATPIDPQETAGELHDRLAALGPELVADVLERAAAGEVGGTAQDERLATRAPKLSRADAWVRFDGAADAARRRVHGLSPWPGCAVRFGESEAKLLRVRVVEASPGAPGALDDGGAIRCAEAALLPCEVQPPGGTAMSYEEFRRGRHLVAGTAVTSVVPLPPPPADASVPR